MSRPTHTAQYSCYYWLSYQAIKDIRLIAEFASSSEKISYSALEPRVKMKKLANVQEMAVFLLCLTNQCVARIAPNQPADSGQPQLINN